MKSFARIALPAAILLAACGDDITEINSNVGAVETSLDLPKCTDDIAGQTAFVKETHEFLGCDGKEWLTLSANTVSVGDNICTSTSLSDGTGFEIFCNGESIGTVTNGKDGKDGADGEDGADGKDGRNGVDGAKGDPGADGKDGVDGKDGADGAKGDQGDPGADGKDGVNGTGCRIAESTALTATIACGSETFTMDLTGYVELPAECDATLYAEDCTGSLDNVSLGGVSQKGPFVIGTDITAFELENGRSLKQTGKTFGGKIERADGTFDIKTVKLKSTFAYLVADGFYRNEVTGENSAATIKLRALTNLQGRATANVNLVTHLEYDRVQRLVTKEDSTVMKAKKAAEREIFAEFGIDNSGFKGYAEDFNILKEGDGNAALLAISALLQGDRNESELTALLASLSVDLGDNGKWDNKQQRAQIADWALRKELSKEGFASIRKNVEGWDLGMGKAPAFEGHMTHFWMQELGVDECSSKNEGALFAVKNVNSSFYAAQDSVFTEGDSSLARLICDANGSWRFATEIEKDTAALSADLPAYAAALGKINTSFVYVKEGAWRRGTDLDSALDFSCIDSVKNYTTFTADATDTTWYICVADGSKLDGYTIPTSWRLAKETEADTAQFGIPTTAADSIKLGHANKGHFYVYENDKWRRGTETDYLLGKACLASMKGEIFVDGANQYFTCTNEKKILADGVIDTCTWRLSTVAEADTFGWAVPSDKADSVKVGNIDKSRVYVYEEGEWRFGTELDKDADLGPCLREKRNQLGKLNGLKGPNAWYICVDDENIVVEGVRVPFVWRKATNYEMDTYDLEGNLGDYSKGKINKNLFYVKESYGWRPATDLEKVGLESCTSAQDQNVKQSTARTAESWFKCTSETDTYVDTFYVAYTWRKAIDIEKDTVGFGYGSAKPSADSVKKGKVTKYIYVYENGRYRIGTLLDSTLKLGGCTSDKANLRIEASVGTLSQASDNTYYMCATTDTTVNGYNVTSAWRRATDLEINTYGLKVVYGACKKVSDIFYVFETATGSWRTTKKNECSIGLEGCYSDIYGQIKKGVDDVVYRCDETGWEVGSELEHDTYCMQVYHGYDGCRYTWTGDFTVDMWICNGSEHYEYSAGELVPGEINSDKYYVCDDRKPRKATSLEISLNKGCTVYNQNETMSTTISDYKCNESGWEIVKGTLNTGRSGEKTYKTVRIGTSVWMAENLNYRYVYPTKTLDSSSYCHEDDCETYGRNYLMSAILDSAGEYISDGPGKGCGRGAPCPNITATTIVQGICPNGWHIPTAAEAEAIVDLGGGLAVDLLGVPEGSDKYGFSATLGYKFFYYEDMEGMGFVKKSSFFASNEMIEDRVYGITVANQSEGGAGMSYYYWTEMNELIYLRCVQD